MNNFADSMFYLIIIGILVGILVDEKRMKIALALVCTFIFIIVIEITKNFSLPQYEYILVLITLSYALLFSVSIFAGILLNRAARHKAIKSIHRGEEK